MSINQIDGWSPQGYFGVTWQPTEKVFFGMIYRTKSDVELDGELSIKGVQGPPPVNTILSSLDDIEMDLTYAQLISVGMRYQANENLSLVMDFDWEDWSQLGKERIEISSNLLGSTVQHADFKWKDTYHVGAAFIYKLDDDSFFSSGMGYDSSPVDDKNRTFILPMDEQFKIGMAYAKQPTEGSNFAYSLGGSWIWFGDGKVDQTAQGVRSKGEFETNYAVFLGATFKYTF
jgi:long-chain fatty acid transport protein